MLFAYFCLHPQSGATPAFGKTLLSFLAATVFLFILSKPSISIASGSDKTNSSSGDIDSNTESYSHSANNSDSRFLYYIEPVSENLGVPWGMVFLNQNRILFTERGGKAGLLNTRSGKATYLKGLPKIWAHGQGGLLDCAVTDDYKAGDWIYFTYSKPVSDTALTTLARAKLSDNELTQWQDLLVTRSASDTTRHFGSRITFDGKGHLFFTVGDRGHRPNGQDLTTHAGSVLRLNLDGTLPPDNPFVGRKDALAEIWSYGHRNPQGIVYDVNADRLWINEHGPRGGDEINLVIKGGNYGWPVVSHGKEYWGPMAVGEATSRPGMKDPRKVYIPSIAPGSLLLYTGEAFPEWRGNLFSGALKLTHLNRVALNDAGEIITEERLLEDLHERVRQVIQSPEGWIYLSTDSGRILRLKPR